MPDSKPFWDALWESLAAPKVSEEELQACLNQVRDKLPTPVFWLLGKTQSGKTSILRGLTGNPAAEIGNGFRPCTRTARIYSFPSEENCFVQFLDTRGLGEVDYDPAEDMAVFERQAHLLLVVVKALDHAQQPVIEALERIRRRHKEWPVIVAQTTLHEGYPSPQFEHVLSYPFETNSTPPPELEGLIRSLKQQRSLFHGIDAQFVPLDFTLPEDGYTPEFYGLDALWDAIETALPLGLRAMLQTSREARDPFSQMYLRKAHPHLVSYAIAAGTAAAWPIPYMGTPLVLAVQAKMFHTLASLYGQTLTRQRLAEIGGAIGGGYLVRLGSRELLKVIPGFGSAVSALFVAAYTYALGRALCAYFEQIIGGGVPEPEMFRRLLKEQYEEGRRRLKDFFPRSGGKSTEPP